MTELQALLERLNKLLELPLSDEQKSRLLGDIAAARLRLDQLVETQEDNVPPE